VASFLFGRFPHGWHRVELCSGSDALASAKELTTLGLVARMPRIKELLTLAKLCYAQANDTLNPAAKKTLQDMGHQYVQKADELRRIEITRAVFPNDKKAV
jgi:hypothetical protein